MFDVEYNWIAVLVATLSGMVLGALWYSKLAFGQGWMDSIGKTEEDLGSPTGPMIGSVVACLLTALAMATLVSLTGVQGLASGAALGALVGVGIVFPALLSDSLFCGWGNKLLLIQSGYRIVYIVVMAAILAAWSA